MFLGTPKLAVQYLRCSKAVWITGYSVLLTRRARISPRKITGTDLRKIGRNFDFIGAARYGGSFKSGIEETMPCENTKEPTPRSIWGNEMNIILNPRIARYRHTSDTPNVSHFASDRGKTGKSTARIERIVKRSMCAR